MADTIAMLVQAMQSTFGKTIRFESMYLTQEPTDYAITHNLTPFVSMQNQYSLLYREEEREMFPTLKVSTHGNSSDANVEHGMLLQMFGVGSIPWSPLGCGLLTRIARDATQRGKTDAWASGYDMPFLGELTTRYVRLDARI